MRNLYLLLALWLIVISASAQITLVKQIDGGSGQFEPLNNLIIFNANGQLWRSDGTSDGTTLITASAKFSNASHNRCRVGNMIYFWRDNVNELWKTDGTPAGTVLVKALGFGFTGPLVSVNGLVLFGFNTQSTGTEIWRSDGTDAGTYMVTDLLPGSESGYRYQSPQSAVLGGYFYFQGPPAPTGISGVGDRSTLYRTDGTAAGTTQVANSGFEPLAMNVVNGRLVYTAYYPYSFTCQGASYVSYNKVLMKLDNGVADVLKLPADVYPYGSTSCPLAPIGNTFLNTINFINSDNYVYFRGQTETNPGQSTAYNIWRTDGTTNGTIQLTNFVSNSGEGTVGAIGNLGGTSNFNFTNLAYIPVKTNASGIELWRSDGTPGGTYLVKDINPGSADSSPVETRTINGTTYFLANNDTNGTELWKTNGLSTGTQLVQDLKPGLDGQPITESIVVNQTYYFYGDNGIQRGLYAVLPAAMYTIKAGNWNDPATWSGNRLPSNADVLTLNHTVTLPSNYTGHALRLIYSTTGQVLFNAGGQLKLANN